MSNEQQKEFWNGSAGDVWVEAQEMMDVMLEPLSQLALQTAAAKTGEKIIDVGCGCGATSLALAESGADVWGVDISEPMLARAQERAAGLGNVRFSVSDAATCEYEPQYDLVFSRFGVMFFDDALAAFTNIRSALVAGGRLVFICWQLPRANDWMSVPGRAAQPFMQKTEPPPPNAPGPFAFADRDWVTDMLQQAGFADIQMVAATPTLKVGQTTKDAMYFQSRVGPMARNLAELDEETQQQAKAAVEAALAEHETADGVCLGSATWIVSAINPR